MDSELGVYVVDDDAAVRNALIHLLRAEGFAARGFDGAEAFLSALPEGAAGCAVLDVNMPGMNGLELQQWLATERPCMSVVFLTGHGDVPKSARAFRCGAVHFLEKPVAGDLLVASVNEGLAHAARRVAEHARRLDVEARLSRLTPREREVMTLVVNGSSSKEIARELGISHRTVESHRAQIMSKMDVDTLPALVDIAVIGGLHATGA